VALDVLLVVHVLLLLLVVKHLLLVHLHVRIHLVDVHHELTDDLLILGTGSAIILARVAAVVGNIDTV
jgi:hypothetical protein